MITPEKFLIKKSNLEQYKTAFRERLSNVPNKPLEIFIEMTHSCNLRCIMCLNTFLDSENKQDISKDILAKVTPFSEYAIAVHPFGIGEPMLHKDFMWTIEEGKSFHAYVSYFTNGTLLTREKAERMVQLEVDRITFSIDGVTRETFERIRQGANYDQVIGNIRTLNAIKNAYGRTHRHSKPELMINFIAMNMNFDQLPDLIRLANELNISYVDVKPLETYNKEMEKWKKTSFSEDDQAIISQAREMARRFEVGLDLSACERAQSMLGSERHESEPSLITNHTCFMPWRTIFVKWDGKVRPCCFGGPILGDVAEQTIEEIWNGPNSRRTRESWSRGEYPMECRRCVELPLRPVVDDIEAIFSKLCSDVYGHPLPLPSMSGVQPNKELDCMDRQRTETT